MPHLAQARITIGDAMGLEAECTVRVGRKASLGRAQLEGETLLFRGDFRLEIPFERMREIAVDGEALVVTADDEARFELGAQVAERWMKLIKQPRGLFEKLEVGSQSRLAVVDINDSLFLSALRERSVGLAEGRVPEGAAVIFFGAETREALKKIGLLRARMVETGTLWIVRPKGGKGISEADVLEATRDAGLVETKVVAFSKTHTAHKCVVPVEMRGQVRRRPPIVTIPPSAPVLAAGELAAKAKGGAPASVRPSSPPPPSSSLASKKGLPPAKKKR
jgi:hypothetical protein